MQMHRCTKCDEVQNNQNNNLYDVYVYDVYAVFHGKTMLKEQFLQVKSWSSGL